MHESTTKALKVESHHFIGHLVTPQAALADMICVLSLLMITAMLKPLLMQSSCDSASEIVLKPEITAIQGFCVEDFIDNNDAIKFYTVFQSYSHLMICFNYLGNAVNHLNYRPGSEATSQRIKSQRALSPLNEFF